MNPLSLSLTEFFDRYRVRREPLVLATVVGTIGSTYRKTGAQMLIAADGSTSGLLSGGCLEGDLMERAQSVFATGQSLIVEYDTRGTDDAFWGIGLGCEGALRILLTSLDEHTGYQPFAYAEQCQRDDCNGAFAFVISSNTPHYRVGQAYWIGGGEEPPKSVSAALCDRSLRAAQLAEDAGARFLVVPVALPTRLLVLGAGPDVMPLVEFAGLLGWRVTVMDHRPAYAVRERFPRARRVVVSPASELSAQLENARFDAAVVMSHHLTSDAAYLSALSDSPIGYVGLLGPPRRRMRLLNDIGSKATQLQGRLRGPVGLDIGGETPETIALAIASEIHAVLCGRTGGALSSDGAARQHSVNADSRAACCTPHDADHELRILRDMQCAMSQTTSRELEKGL